MMEELKERIVNYVTENSEIKKNGGTIPHRKYLKN